VLVPRRPAAREIIDLGEADRRLLIEEIAAASRVLQTLHRPDKINIGVLGNLVPQLHVHVIARFTGDPAWPRPVWGVQPPVPYAAEELDTAVATLRKALGV
jgi:diadenosine tetraphosphate (Ap4A) HIT family hydrolase